MFVLGFHLGLEHSHIEVHCQLVASQSVEHFQLMVMESKEVKMTKQHPTASFSAWPPFYLQAVNLQTHPLYSRDLSYHPC